jgi:hypothetical protein
MNYAEKQLHKQVNVEWFTVTRTGFTPTAIRVADNSTGQRSKLATRDLLRASGESVHQGL